MKIQKTCALIASAALLTLGSAAFATEIHSIDMEVRSSSYSYTDNAGTASLQDLIDAFDAGTLVCDVSLDALDMVGGTQNCGGPNNNIATLFSIDITQVVTTIWQFGADWGRGGAAFLTNGGSGAIGYPGDYWWELDFSNPDVIEFPTNGSGSYTLNLLGFEGCCGGAMSLRWTDDGADAVREGIANWNIAAVTVAEPSTLALLGLALFGVGSIARRRRS